MKPIIFNPDMVKAILSGAKSQTRRPIKINSEMEAVYQQLGNGKFYTQQRGGREIKPKYQPGDVLWVRERARVMEYYGNGYQNWGSFKYEVDGTLTESIRIPKRLKPMKAGNCCSNGCFKELARIFLKVTAVRVERIQDITDDDAMAEGVELEQAMSMCCSDGFRAYFSGIWESCYPGSYERNDFVWVYEFERTEKCK